MGLQPNRALTGGAARPGGLFGLLESWFKPTGRGATGPGGAPAAAGVPAQPSLQDLLDRLNLTGGRGQSAAVTDPTALTVLRQLSRPGQTLAVTPAGWEALAKQWTTLTPTARAQVTAQLRAGGVAVSAGTDGRYVSFSSNDLRVTADPSTNRIRRTQGANVLCYQGPALVQAMKVNGDRVDVTTRAGTQTWYASTGEGFANGLPVTPRMAAPVPGEPPRRAWAAAGADDLVEPPWSADTPMSTYAPAYDQAVEATGGTVVKPATVNTPPADMYNCHSFATTGGQGDLFDPFMRETHPHWLNNPMYRLTNGPFAQLEDGQQVHPGDVVVYRKGGVVTHTGVVKQVDADGNPTTIESKFGTLGLYDHAPFDVPAEYGEPSQFFRPESA